MLVKYQYFVLTAVLLASLLFIIARVPKRLPKLYLRNTGTWSTSVSNKTKGLECKHLAPYSMVKNTTRKFTLCLTNKTGHLEMNCPENTFFDQDKKLCVMAEDCSNMPNGSKIYVTSLDQNIPLNRAYHTCWGDTTYLTSICPPGAPVFDGNSCIENDGCYKMPDGWRYPHEKEKESYYECINERRVLKECPESQLFFINRCIDTNVCHDQADGSKLHDPNDSSGYITCANGAAVKRKCGPGETFHKIKKKCVSRGICQGKAGRYLSSESEYGIRSINGINCISDWDAEAVRCDESKQVFDESTGKCRLFDLGRDLKPNKVYPINNDFYYDQSSSDLSDFKRVTFGMKVDTNLGVVTSMCEGKWDGLKFGPALDSGDLTKYIVCLDNSHVVKTCQPLHVFDFESRTCIFSPCSSQEAGSHGVLKDNRRYFCREGVKHTFEYTCPVGTTARGNVCEPVGSVKQQHRRAPYYVNEHEYTDTDGETYRCKGQRRLYQGYMPLDIENVASKYYFKCVETPCDRINRTSWPLVPLDEHEAVECLNGRVENHINCGKKRFVNFRKVLTGYYELPDCLEDGNGSRNWGANKISSNFKETMIFNRSQLNSLLNDNMYPDDVRNPNTSDTFTPNGFPKAEVLGETIGEVVPNKNLLDVPHPPKGKPDPERPCSDADRESTSISGYPRYVYKCKTKSYHRCYDSKSRVTKLFVGGKCQSGISVFPVFSSCTKFALGTDTETFRVFYCPRKVPYYNAITGKCEGYVPEGHLFCGHYLRKNIESLSASGNTFKEDLLGSKQRPAFDE